MSDKNFSFRLYRDHKIEGPAVKAAEAMLTEQGEPMRYCDDMGMPLPIRTIMAVALCLLAEATKRYTAEVEAVDDSGAPISIFSILRWGESALRQYETPQDDAVTLEEVAGQLKGQYEAIRHMLDELRSAGIQVSADRSVQGKRGAAAASLLANMAKNFSKHDGE